MGKTAGCVYVPQLWWENLAALPAKSAPSRSGFEEEGHEPRQGRRENNRTALRQPLLCCGGASSWSGNAVSVCGCVRGFSVSMWRRVRAPPQQTVARCESVWRIVELHRSSAASKPKQTLFVLGQRT